MGVAVVVSLIVVVSVVVIVVVSVVVGDRAAAEQASNSGPLAREEHDAEAGHDDARYE